jgi:two-component system sensor histidine kinase/response regulator
MNGKPTTDTIIDADGILAQFGGDYEVAREVIEVFLEDNPKALAGLREAVQGQDSANIRKCAHSLKGAASNFSAQVAGTADELEQMGAAGSLQGAQERLVRLEEEVARLEAALTALDGGRSIRGRR